MDLGFQRHKMFHNWSKNNNVSGIHSKKIAFLVGGVSNLADSHTNIHLSLGGRHQLNNCVCFKSNKHTIRFFCSTGVMYLSQVECMSIIVSYRVLL